MEPWGKSFPVLSIGDSMLYKTLKYIPGSDNNQTKKDVILERARSYDDIRFRIVFLNGDWLTKGKTREIRVVMPANGQKDDHLWPIVGKVFYDRDLGTFVWWSFKDVQNYVIKGDGSLGRRL